MIGVMKSDGEQQGKAGGVTHLVSTMGNVSVSSMLSTYLRSP